MIKTISLLPGITLRCCRDSRFKQNCLSIQLIRPMSSQEAALNALIPAILLRGCQSAPDLRSITLRLDDLYGAAVGPLVRRIGDFQTTGFYCSFIDDRYTLEADSVLAPMVDFLRQLLLEPLTEKGVFCKEFVKGEKTNLISAIDSQKNDKRAYAAAQLLRKMCANDPFGIPRLGESAHVRKITPKSAYAHYQKILKESPIHLFYVGSAEPEQVAQLLKSVFEQLERDYVSLPEQTPFQGGKTGTFTETMDVSQGKLCMGFSTPVTIRDADFAAMQMLNTVLGGGMTSKLFMNIREKQSLCYDIGSAYYGSKGIVTVSAGIDCDKKDFVVGQIMQQLESCRSKDISQEEMDAAREYLLSGLRSTTDSPGAIESFFANGAISGLTMDLQQYADAVMAVTLNDVAAAAEKLSLQTTFFLKGVQ